MSRIKKATEAEWRAMGEQVKHCRRELFKLMSMVNPYVPKKISSRLSHYVIKHFDRFRSEIEEEMFRRGGPGDIYVFYDDY